ncbi:MAG: hypothetical protein MK102_03260 [Fuerstiella sp.]|nr:hypothetical protein [Fuerstiella sp.]
MNFGLYPSTAFQTDAASSQNNVDYLGTPGRFPLRDLKKPPVNGKPNPKMEKDPRLVSIQADGYDPGSIVRSFEACEAD